MLFSFFRRRSQSRKPHRKRTTVSLAIEQLEDRFVPSTFNVLNLQNSGAGSLRQAILDANAHAGADTINFSVAGTIRLTSGTLPVVTDPVNIDGTTAPGFAGTPVVEVDYNRFGGVRFYPGSAGSALRSLGLVNANGAGVTVIRGGAMIIVGNFIGLRLDGVTAGGNRGDGLLLKASTGNTIGGTTAQDRNVISGNQGNGIYLYASSGNQIMANFIGTDAAGSLARGNAKNGILAFHSHDNLIGHSDPVTGVTYYNADNVSMQPVSGWQGIRGSDTNGQYLIAGTSDANGLLFEGTIAGVGTSYSVNYPGAYNTSVYGPDNLDGSNIRLVGSYKNPNYATALVEVHGFLFEGTTAELSNPGHYRSIDYPGAKFNYVHSTMGGLVVGNYDSPPAHGMGGLPLGPGHAYIYDIAQDSFLTDIVFPGSLSNTAYGIWYNGGTSYTICGGYSPDVVNNFDDQSQPIGQGYLVDYDSATGQFSHWKSFSYPKGTNFITHFESISSVEKGVYTLSADSVQSGTTDPVQGSWVTVRRNTDGSFGDAVWVDLNYTGVDPTTHVTSSNSVYGNRVVGIVIGGGAGISFQATVNLGFQLSNVISGNGANGIALFRANANRIAMNYIGTDVTGTLDRGNASNGILVTNSSARNLIGGEATGGNDPTNDVFVRPPQGNLISGNDANGVLITNKAMHNQLSGNFIGTAASGNAALGNSLDGVAIVKANNNSLIGCTFQEDPFVFYNVISGNGGNGLRVTSSNDTTIQANFFGMGANNNTAVGNALNGVVVEGTSTRTTMGGPIPLGNVDAANGQNGIVVRDRASFFTSYNTFTGLAAFSDNPHFGNGQDGMLITSTGGNILIRTCVVTRNGDDGIEISGNARGVRVTGNIVGLNTNGFIPMGNLGNGVEVGGNASDIVIGGPQPTFNVIPQNVISANGANGVAIVGAAHNIRVSHGYIGTDFGGQNARGNAGAGVLLSPGTYSTTIGSTDPNLLTVISGNQGNGIEMRGTRGNTVVGCLIGTNAAGLLPLPNEANGVFVSNSFDNIIGRAVASANGAANVPANLIAFNHDNGVFIESGLRNGICENSIHSNTLLGIDLGAGANLNQASPVLTSVQALPLGLMVTGTLTSRPLTTFTIEFFANTVNGPSGRIFLGSQKVKTNAAGVAEFTFYGPLPPAGANFITATATDPNDNTSEFSAAVS